MGGWVSNLFLLLVQLPAILAMTFCGTMVVQRYSIDIEIVKHTEPLTAPIAGEKSEVREAEELQGQECSGS